MSAQQAIHQQAMQQQMELQKASIQAMIPPQFGQSMNATAPAFQPTQQMKIISYTIGGTRFDLPQQYSNLKLLGNGAYGVVV